MLKNLMNMRTTRVLAATSLATLFLASCGGGGSDTESASNAASTETLASEAGGTTGANAAADDVLLATSSSTTWTRCASEYGTCRFSGTKTVRYGLGTKWATRTATGSIVCNNNVFGDPYPGANKVCDVANTSSTPTTTTPTTPTTTTPTTSASAPYGQDASKYEMVWSDEFESGFNTGAWNDKIWYESSNATKNYAVENGALKIWPQRDASGKFFNRTIDTDGKKYFTYGYYEIEAKLPYGKGVWPAFWLLNHDKADPYRPEIDILEAYPGGGPGGGWGTSDLKPNAFRGTIWPKGINGGPEGGHKTLQGLPDLSAGFHKYAVKWEPNKITFLFDGKEYYSANVSMPNRMYVLLDLWYGSASGKPDNSTPTGKANAFEVNYVRVWKNK